MFCKNCGSQMDNKAVICVKCGCPTGQGTNFCPNCGQPTMPGAPGCVTCGAPLYTAPPAAAKSKIAGGLLGIFLGAFGAHNFYLGYTGKAIAQLLITILTCGIGAAVTEIWGLVEGIMILSGSGSYKTDAKGIPLGE